MDRQITQGAPAYRGQRSKQHGERSTDLHELRLSGTHHRFDRMTFKNAIDILGFFLGYMSGPIIEESREEREERHRRFVVLPEGASPTGIAL